MLSSWSLIYLSFISKKNKWINNKNGYNGVEFPFESLITCYADLLLGSVLKDFVNVRARENLHLIKLAGCTNVFCTFRFVSV